MAQSDPPTSKLIPAAEREKWLTQLSSAGNASN